MHAPTSSVRPAPSLRPTLPLPPLRGLLATPLGASAAVLGALAGVALVGLAVDPRTLLGEPVWVKPLKFCVSGTLYIGALSVLLRPVRALPRTSGTRRAGRVAEWGVAGIVVVETVLIAVQAARGVRSHFNVATAFDAALFSSMGTLITVLWALTLVAAVAVARAPQADRLARAAALWALGIALAGGATGYLMTDPTPEQAAAFAEGPPATVGAHTVGAADGGPGLPVVGWSTVAGDLRVPHFWGLHGLQAVPLLALALRRRPGLSARQRGRLLAVGAAAYAGVFGVLLQQALRGQPLVAPDALTAGALGALALAGAAAAARILRRP